MEEAHMLPDILQVQDWIVKKRYILCSSHPPRLSRISQFPVESDPTPIHVPPLWPVMCPTDFYKGDETDSGFPEREWVCVIIYKDDILIMAQNQALAYQHLLLTLDVLEL